MELDDTLDNYIRKTIDFHGCFQKAPGVVIGCYMVEYALELLGDFNGYMNAVVETRVCLSDCVQMMTGCTYGNKAMWVREGIGRYATTLYDRDTKEGVRVFLDIDKVDKVEFPDLHAFHLRQRDTKVLTDTAFRKKSGEKVVQQFLQLKRDALSFEYIAVTLPRKGPMHPSVRCESCGEPFLKPEDRASGQCPSCTGEMSYYDKRDPASIEADRPVKSGGGSKTCSTR